MAYSSIDEVQALLPLDVQVDQTTHPTYAEVTNWLSELDSTINVAITAGGVVLPITGDILAWVSQLVAKRCAYQVMQARGAAAKEESLWQGYLAEWEEAIKKLESPETSVAAGASALKPSSYTMNAPDNPDSTVNPVFKREQAHQW